MSIIRQSLCEHETYLEPLDGEKKKNKKQKIKVIETLLSVVFLHEKTVYKVKKPVNYDYVDFTTLKARLFYCIKEIILNRRLAPHVYLGVVPIYKQMTSGQIRIKTDRYWPLDEFNLHSERTNSLMCDPDLGDCIEFAVQMVFLPDEYNLQQQLQGSCNPKLSYYLTEELVSLLIDFHTNAAEHSSAIDQFGSYETISQNVCENFHQTLDHVQMFHKEVYEECKRRSMEQMSSFRSFFQKRIEEGFICDTHGDLRLEHIYLLPTIEGKQSEEDNRKLQLVVIDCIEFNERFRYSDPIADVAFLFMDIWYRGHSKISFLFMNSYLEKLNLHSSSKVTNIEKKSRRDLFNFYGAYRAIVRAKVSGFQYKSLENDSEENCDDETKSNKEKALRSARSHWLLALFLLRPPHERSALILISGLPGSGKSTLASFLLSTNDFSKTFDDRNFLSKNKVTATGTKIWIRSDCVRKKLAESLSVNEIQNETGTDIYETGIYTKEFTHKTYAKCLQIAQENLELGKRVIVDATFQSSNLLYQFKHLAQELQVICLTLECSCEREIVRDRLRMRQENISDANWDVYLQMEEQRNKQLKSDLSSTSTSLADAIIHMDKQPLDVHQQIQNLFGQVGLA